MSVPSALTHRYAKKFLVTGPTLRPRVVDQNPAEGAGASDPDRFAPVVRLTSGGQEIGPLIMMWAGVDRQLNAGDSYQQPIGSQGAGGVASYSWSGGGSGSTKTYNFGSPGLQQITCTVTDDNGVSSTGRRWAKVVNPPGVGAANTWPITTFRVDSLVEQLAEAGWGGCRARLTVWNADPAAFTPGTLVAIYVEWYEAASAGALASMSAPTASGEVFCGVVESLPRTIHPFENRFVVNLVTLEAWLGREGRDGGDHVFIDRAVIQELGSIEPGWGGGDVGGLTSPNLKLVELYPWHEMENLSLLKAAYHLLRYHVIVDVDTDNNGSVDASYSPVDLVGLQNDWWNTGDDADQLVWAFNVPRGNLMRAIAGMAPPAIWRLFATRTSALSLTVIHEAKTSPDGSSGTIDPSRCYAPVEVLPGDEHPVSQVKLIQTPASIKVKEEDIKIRVYPASPDSVGSIVQPARPLWFTTDALGDRWAKAIYDYGNATQRARLRFPGAPLGLHNWAVITLAEAGWSNQAVVVERVEHEFDDGVGNHRTTVTIKEIG